MKFIDHKKDRQISMAYVEYSRNIRFVNRNYKKVADSCGVFIILEIDSSDENILIPERNVQIASERLMGAVRKGYFDIKENEKFISLDSTDFKIVG